MRQATGSPQRHWKLASLSGLILTRGIFKDDTIQIDLDSRRAFRDVRRSFWFVFPADLWFDRSQANDSSL
jgi:hypothetical protein